MQKQLLDTIAIDNDECLDTEEAIREKIQELNVSFSSPFSESSANSKFPYLPAYL